MSFGCVNGPCDCPDFMNEPVTYLGKNLLNYPDWDETEVYSTTIEKLGDHVLLPDQELFYPALPLDVQFPFSLKGNTGSSYNVPMIHDLISVGREDI